MSITSTDPLPTRPGQTDPLPTRLSHVTPVPTGLVSDCLALLADLDRESDGPRRPPDLLLAALRGRHPEHRFTLAVDDEPYDGSTEYGLIVRRPDGAGTVSLSLGAAQALPWPLRGVVRPAESDLLEVNGVRLAVAEAMTRIEASVFDRPLMRMLIDGCLVEQELAADPVPVSGAELQATADAWRRAKGLHRRQELELWLTDRGLTAADFTQLIRRHAELAGLRARVAGGRIEDWWADHVDDLARLTLAWVAAAGTAPETAECRRLRADPWAVVLEAAAHGRPGGVVQVRAGELVGRRITAQTSPPVPLSHSRIGDVVLVELETPALAVVVDRRPAVPDEGTRSAVVQRIFDEWLAERRATARISWFWGEQRRTAA